MQRSPVDVVERLVAESGCRDLSGQYCRHLDHLDPEAFAALWTEDGEYKPAASTSTIVGREAILAWARSYPTDRLGRHLSTNQIIEVTDSDRAVGSSYSVVFREPRPEIGAISTRVVPRSVVEYQDKYWRTSDGWRFASRVYTYSFLEA